MKKDLISVLKYLGIFFSISLILPLIIFIIVYSVSQMINGYSSEWISFWGSIIGGVLTLFGVKWTIDEQREDKKRELSIMYQPFLALDVYKKYYMPINNKKDKDSFIGMYSLCIGNEKPNKVCIINYKLRNLGNGECYLNSYENTQIKSDIICVENKIFNTPLHNDLVSLIVDKGWGNVICRNDYGILQISILYNSEEQIEGYIKLLFNLEYSDQFNYVYYDAKCSVAILVKNKNNKTFINEGLAEINNDRKIK